MPFVSGRRRFPSNMVVSGISILMCVCLVHWIGVSAMVITTPRQRVGGGRTSTSNMDPSSEEVIRMLLRGQGRDPMRRRNQSSSSDYTIKSVKHRAQQQSKSQQTQQTTANQSETKSQTQTSSLLDKWRDYEALRETDLEDEVLRPFFFESGWERKQVIVERFATVLGTLYKAQADWNQAQLEKQNNASSEVSAAVSGQEEVSLAPPSGDDPAALALCEAIASLGPLAVKLGQTLSQRPDIVGRAACDALKRLQTQNTPFENDLARAVLRESLGYWDGPLAGDGESESSQGTGGSKPLFRSLSEEPIASASLGQVYKATTWDGVDVALKVQRPDALSILAIDTQCFRIASAFRNTVIDWTEKWNGLVASSSNGEGDVPHSLETGMTEEEVRSLGPEGTVASVIDRVARDIKREMDYRIEAENSYKFRDSLEFLGFVDTPEVLLATDKVLATTFVDGHHLANLPESSDQLALTRMAVEACTASMVLTGFVHADPHEGNLMLRNDDGRIVFLDFGLMSDVDQDVMEAFARGIAALLSEDFVSMTEAFTDTGFITAPIMHRASTDELWRVDPDFGQDELALDLEKAMKSTEGGMSRFGALATVLNKKISPRWLVFTPPYVLLLIRTFLTLEGIAAQVDPDFNIYEMSMPWVVRRSLSPSTEKGRKVLRSIMLKPDNTIQWERILELLALQKEATQVQQAAAVDTESREPTTSSSAATSAAASAVDHANDGTSTVAAATTQEEKERKQREYAVARQGAMKDAIGKLLGSTNGRALRGVLKDLDTPDLIWKLGSREGQPIVEMGTETILNKYLFSALRRSGNNKKERPPIREAETTAGTTPRSVDYRPVSDQCKALKKRQAQRTKQVTRILLKSHLKRCLFRIKGIAGMVRLIASTLKVMLSIILRKIIRKVMVSLGGNREASVNSATTVA